MIKVGIINSGLRALGLLGRFGLILYLAKFLGLEAVAIFGQIFAVVSILPAILNFGIHFRTNRLLVGALESDIGQRVRDRLVLHTIVFIPICSIGFAVIHPVRVFPFLSGLALACISVVSLVELFLNEVHLALLNYRRPTIANFIYFLRSAAWVLPFACASYLLPALRNIETIFIFWFFGQILAFAVLFYYLRDWPWSKIRTSALDIPWLFNGWRASAVLWLSDIGLTSGQFIDRFILGAFLDIQAIGAFIFLWSLANGVYQLVYTAVIQVSYPHYVISAKKFDWHHLNRQLKTDTMYVVVYTSAISSAVLFIAPYIFSATGKPQLNDYSLLFAQILFAMGLKLLSDLVASALYARELDYLSGAIGIALPAISAFYSVCGLYIFGFDGIGIALIATHATVLVIRFFVHLSHQ